MKSMTYEGAQVAHLYRLSLDMAKELAIVENNDHGRLVRRYFIWADDQRRQIMSAASAPLALDNATKAVWLRTSVPRALARGAGTHPVRSPDAREPSVGG